MITTLHKYRRLLVAILHIALIIFANYLAFWLRFDGLIPAQEIVLMSRTLPWLLIVRGLMFIPFRLYDGLWRYTGIWDLRNIVVGVFASTLVFAILVYWVKGLSNYPLSVMAIDGVFLICFMGGIRLARRLYWKGWYLERKKRVLIYGAGDAGEMIVRDMKKNNTYAYEPVGFVDDDPAKVGQRIHGVRVMGTRHHLQKIMATAKPHEVLVAIPRAEPATIREMVKAMEPFKVPITTLPNLRDILDGRVAVNQIRTLVVEDLLPRAPVGLDPAPVQHLIAGKRILVTGAGGSIGAELSRQMAALRPRELILLDRYENSLYAISNDLVGRNGHLSFRSIIGDITDAQRVEAVMAEYQPEIVFHAAAHKHVPLMETSPCEAVKNNVFGTRIVAEAAAKYGTERFVLISSDKAVNPSSVMGATKRIAEMLIQDLSRYSATRFLAVRFGNVLGSNGSVVPRFLAQIEAGGPVTITHPEVQRYFMLIPEAIHLVIHAAALGQRGTIYVLDMGEQIKVLDMARNLIRLSGFIPDEEIPIVFIGLRPGEKLFEELAGTDEKVVPSGVEKIFQIQAGQFPVPDFFASKLMVIEQQAIQGDTQAVLDLLHELVPTFRLQHVNML